MATVAVIGGGVSGLSAAYYLSRAPLPNLASIVVLEAGTRLGGWIHSRRSNDGAVFEYGPRTLRPYGRSGLNTLQLVADLGLQHRMLKVPKTDPAAKKRFVFANGQLHALPAGMKSAMSPFAAAPFSESFPKILVREAVRKYPSVADESVHDFIARHFGLDLANYVINPLCRGIFAGDSRLLSAKSCFAAPFQLAAAHGSLVRGAVKGAGAQLARRLCGVEAPPEKRLSEDERRWKENIAGTAVWSLKGGLQDLTDALTERLAQDPRVEIRFNSPVSSVAACSSSSGPDDCLRVTTTGAASFDADHVISSIYAADLAGALTSPAASAGPASTAASVGEWRRDSRVDELAASLSAIPAVTVCVVNLEYPGDVLPFPGFGYLVPSFESEPLLGCVFDSAAIPYHNAQTGKTTTRLTVMLGGAWYEPHFGRPSSPPPLAEFEEMAMSAVRDHLDIKGDPSRTHVTLQKNCIPQYLVGHGELLSQIDSNLLASRLPLSLVGSSFKGVSVNDCIFNSKKEVESVVDKLRHFQPIRSTETVDPVSRGAKVASFV